MPINSSYYIVDAQVPYSEDILRSLTQSFNSIDRSLGNYIKPALHSFGAGENQNDSLHDVFRAFEEERAEAVRTGRVPNYNVRDIVKNNGRNASLLHLFVDYSSIESETERKKLIDSLKTIEDLFAGCVIIALSKENIELNDDSTIIGTAKDFAKVLRECWIRVVVASFGRRFGGTYVIKDDFIACLTNLVAQDVVCREDMARILSRRPAFGFSYEIFSARYKRIDVDALVGTLLSDYRAGLIQKIHAEDAKSTSSTEDMSAKNSLEKIVDGTGFSLQPLSDERACCKTKNGDYTLGNNSWHYQSPGFRKKTVVNYLQHKNDEFTTAESRFAQTTEQKISRLIYKQTIALEDSVLDVALHCESPDQLNDYCDKKLRDAEWGFAVSTNKKRDDNFSISCEAELDRFPRFFPKYFISTLIFLVLTGWFLYYWRFRWALYSLSGGTVCVGIWLILRQLRIRRCRDAVLGDYKRLETRWLNNATTTLASAYQKCWRRLRVMLGDKGAEPLDDEEKKVVNLRAFALQTQTTLAEASRVQARSFQDTAFLTRERVPELLNYLRERWGLEGGKDVADFNKMTLGTVKSILHDATKTFETLETKIDEYCRQRLQSCLKSLNLAFFLRDNFLEARINVARLVRVMLPDNNDIYARGSLTREMIGAVERDLRPREPALTRKYILTPAGIEIGGNDAKGYVNVRTNWERECLSATFWELYSGNIESETKNDEN